MPHNLTQRTLCKDKGLTRECDAPVVQCLVTSDDMDIQIVAIHDFSNDVAIFRDADESDVVRRPSFPQWRTCEPYTLPTTS